MSSDPATSTPRRRASSRMRVTISCSGAACQSSTFMDTWTRPAPGRSSPSARTPVKPPPVSRTTPAISRAASSGPRRFTLKAMSGRRAPTITPPADGSSRDGPKSGTSSALSNLRCSWSVPPLRKKAGPRPGGS